MSAPSLSARTQPIRSDVPARMDRLPWSKFHWMVIVGLGVSWILDGLEIQLVAAEGFKQTLHMDEFHVGIAAWCYLMGEVVGALTFGRMTDRLGRKNLFILTLAIYLVGSGVAGFAMNMWWLYVWRFVAGLGIGGEYTAINSAIDELIPAKFRGRVDLAVNGTYWAGAMLGSIGSFFLLDPKLVPEFWGWRIAFFIGPFMGLIIIFIRRHIPESPRWMVTHGKGEEAEQIVSEIEDSVRADGKEVPPIDDNKDFWVKPQASLPFKQLVEVFIHKYPSRTVLGLTMMITQSFLYNAIFFTYSMVLQNFYHLQKSEASVYFIPFAIGNLAGPLLLGHLFDTVGRRKMIFATYTLAGAVLTVSAILFQAGLLTAVTHTALWCLSFFFASAGASSAYLTVSEIFPLEVRGQAISYFFAVAQLCGAIAPVIFSALVGKGTDRVPLFWGYIMGSVIMAIGGIVALKIGVDAEGKGLEDVADPLSKYDGEGDEFSSSPGGAVDIA